MRLINSAALFENSMQQIFSGGFLDFLWLLEKITLI